MSDNGYPGNPGNDNGGYDPYGQDPNAANPYGAQGGQAPQGGYGAQNAGYEGQQGGYGAQNAGYEGQQGGYGAQNAAYGAPGAQHGPPGEGVRQRGGDEAPEVPVATYAPGARIGDAFNFGFKAFGRAAVPWIGFTILLFVVFMIIGLVFGLLGAFQLAATSGPGSVSYEANALQEPTPMTFIMNIVMTILVGFATALAWRGALEQVDGRSLQFGDFFRIDNWGPIALGALLSGVIGFVLQLPSLLFPPFVSIFTFLLAILIGPFYGYLLAFIVDRRLNPIDALKANVEAAKANYAGILVMTIIVAVVCFAGAILCLVGLLVALPAAVLMTAHLYRQVTAGRRPIDAVA
ncbi:hypothetical protein [Corynebacterium sp. 335C]